MKKTWNHFEKTQLFKGALECAQALQAKGYEAYFVGGCVRDLLLGKTPNDVDMATSATPEQMDRVFVGHKILDHGRRFGTLAIQFGDEFYEVTTFRGESDYSDHRHPGEVHWSDRKMDAARRDFTINALFYDPVSKELIDDFDGVGDLNNKTIRTVGEAQARFGEDSLRVLRAIRFVAQTGFGLEKETFKSIKAIGSELSELSSERIHLELGKLFKAEFHGVGFRLLCETGVLSKLFKNFLEISDLQSLLKLSSEVDLNPGEYWLLISYWIAQNKTQFKEVLLRDVLRSKEQRKVAQWVSENHKLFADGELISQLKALETAEGVFLYELATKLSKEPSKLRSLREKFLRLSQGNGVLPSPIVKASDLKDISGEQLGKALRKAYKYQLELEIFEKDELVKKLMA